MNLLKTSLFLCFLVSEGLFFKVRADSYDLYPSYPMAARKNDMAAGGSVLGSYETGSEEFEMEYGFISLKKSSESKGYGLGGKFSLDLFRAVRLGGIFRYKSREEEIKNQTEVETTEGVLDPEVFLEAQYGVGGNFVEFGVKYSPKTQDPISASKDKKGTPGNGGDIYEVKGTFLGKSGSFYLYPSFHYFSYGSSKLKDQDGEITTKDAYSCYKIMIESGILLNQNASFFAKVSFTPEYKHNEILDNIDLEVKNKSVLSMGGGIRMAFSSFRLAFIFEQIPSKELTAEIEGLSLVSKNSTTQATVELGFSL